MPGHCYYLLLPGYVFICIYRYVIICYYLGCLGVVKYNIIMFVQGM